nr:hypothetical protein GCM10020093_009440 [Planobispora longispora]
MLSHANITWNSVNVLVDIDVLADEATLVAAPLFHTAGLNMTCLPTLLKGGRVVLLGAFDPGRVLELIETERITQMFGVPTMFDAMAGHPRWAGTDLSSLRTLNCGGAPVPLRTIETYLRRGLDFSQGYGMTEASPACCTSRRSRPWPRPVRPGCRTSSPTRAWCAPTAVTPRRARRARSSSRGPTS